MSTRTVLHVDDDPLFRRAMRRVFEAAGWEVLEADQGETGFRLAKTAIPQLILLDIRMPVQDGFQTLGMLKKTMETNEIPVVMCSSLGSKEDIQFCLQGGAIGYLVKTQHHPEEMLAYIHRLFGMQTDGSTV